MTDPAPSRSAPRPIAVLFDLDGTLIDSIDLLLGAFRHAFGMVVGRIPPEEAWVAGIGTPLVTQMREFARSEEELETLIATYRAYQREHHDRLIREFEGARDTLALIHGRGHPTALVTSKIVELAVRALDYTRLHEFIDVVIGADLCERHKPDPEPVRLALRELGYAPEEAVFVGDSPHDIGAGNAAGVVTIAAHWGPFDAETLKRADPTYSIDHITQLPAVIDRLGARRAGPR